jgi:hypothetical protein
MSYRTLEKAEAKATIEQYEAEGEVHVEKTSLTKEEKSLRNLFSKEFSVKGPISPEKDYPLGLKLYIEWLPLGSIDLRQASDDGFWRNLTCRVLPDYVLRRWPAKNAPEEQLKLAHSRYYNQAQRNWLKIIWWMVHLSWQGSRSSTKATLKHLGSDAISQVVERTGVGGYNVDLCRKIIQKISEYDSQTSAEKALRRAMKLNTMRSQTIIPEFHDEGLEGYVSSLFPDGPKNKSREERH